MRRRKATRESATHCHPTDGPCGCLCDGCTQANNLAINTAYIKAHPFDCQTEPGRPFHYGPADIRVIAPATIEEYKALKMARDAIRPNTKPVTVDSLAAALLAGVV